MATAATRRAGPHACRHRPRDRPQGDHDDHVVGDELLGRGQGSDTKILAVLRNAIDNLNSGNGAGLRDTDIAKTLIELSSQTAAYQAALRSGANIVQSSLMDFLR